jgi:hypothetical protein
MRLEGVKAGGIGGDHEGEVSSADDMQRGVKDDVVEEVEPICVIGPAQHENVCQEDGSSNEGRCEEVISRRAGPKFLRTKKGDLCVGGPRKHGQAYLGPTTKKQLEEKSSTKSLRAGRRNTQSKKSLPELPPKKM